MPDHSASPITFRSVIVGLLGVCIICGLTPYNDWALDNTYFVGNNLPLGLIVLTFCFAIFINAPLSYFAPRHAFTASETAVAFSMMLVSCTLPSSGLIRYLTPALISPFWHARVGGDYMALIQSLHLPHWLFPTFSSNDPRDWPNDPVVTGYYARWTDNSPFPLRAWIAPFIAWGIFTFAMYGAILCIITLIRRQWYENERLPFPLTQIYLSLVTPPPPKKFFNATLQQRTFWIGFFAVFFIHAWNGLHTYYPKVFPEIFIHYNLTALFAQPPWVYVDTKVKEQLLFFTVIGVTFFLSSSISFSLWFFYIAYQLYRMLLGTYVGDPTPWGQRDAHFGGLLAYAIVIFWIGRHHWLLILRQAFFRQDATDIRGRYLPYRFAFWSLCGCIAVMIGFLMIAGATFAAATVTVLLLLLLFIIIARFVAEAGLVHGQLLVTLMRPWQLLATAGYPRLIPIDSFYVCSILETTHFDFRETLSVYGTHAIKVADETIFNAQSHDDFGLRNADFGLKESAPSSIRNPRSAIRNSTGPRFIALLFLSLLVGYCVSFTFQLLTEYSYASSKDVAAKTPISTYATQDNPKTRMLEATLDYQKDRTYLRYNPTSYISFGFIFTAALSFLRLRFTWWPLHPIGYLMLGSYPAGQLWLSIFLGWLAKVLTLRAGGPSLYARLKPFFLGIIVGESAAAGLWLVTGLIMSFFNLPYRPIMIMPA